MLEPLIKAIQDAVIPHAVDDFYSRPLHLPPAEPLAEPLIINTLSGLSAYIQRFSEVDFPLDDVAVHVVNHQRVDLIGKLEDRHRQRETLASARFEPLAGALRFGQWQTQEDFIIALQSLFQPTEHRDYLLGVAGNVVSDTTIAYADDGVTATATLKSGVRRLENQRIVAIGPLKPYRTFLDVEQPASNFLFRLRPATEKTPPQFALFEADGGAWKLAAVDAIREYFAQKMFETFNGELSPIAVIA